MTFDYASLERRVAALESAQTASLRFGRVTAGENGKTRVQFGDGDNFNSYSIPTLQKRVLKDQDIKMPDIGEPVACLFAGNGCEQGVCLGAYYNDENAGPGQPASMDYKKYSDGTQIWYDRENHKLIARVNGDAEIECEKTISAKAKQDVNVESETRIKLKAPEIEIAGFLHMADVNGNPGKGTLSGDFTVINGGISVPDKDVTAGSVSLRAHQHENSGVSGTGGKPVGG